MSRMEVLEELFDGFSPFEFKESEKRKIDKNRTEEFLPFLENLKKAKKVKVELESWSSDFKANYELFVSPGMISFIENMLEFQNKAYVDNNAHATEGALTNASEKKMNTFFTKVFNRQEQLLLSEEDEYEFMHTFDLAHSENENNFSVVFYEEDPESIEFTII